MQRRLQPARRQGRRKRRPVDWPEARRLHAARLRKQGYGGSTLRIQRDAARHAPVVGWSDSGAVREIDPAWEFRLRMRAGRMLARKFERMSVEQYRDWTRRGQCRAFCLLRT